jgi:WD repeat-containing protein 19
MWARAGQADKALGLYVQVCSPDSLAAAVALLEATRAADAAPTLLSALDSCAALEPQARDALGLRVNVAAGQLGTAARAALAVARHEQELGNYKVAHAKLFGMLQQLHALGAAVPLEFRQALALLHSYVLVRSLLAVGDHMGAARMLVRVAANISKCAARQRVLLRFGAMRRPRVGFGLV